MAVQIFRIPIPLKDAFTVTSPARTSMVLDATVARSYLAANAQGKLMTQFDDRERAFESKFAHDEEMKFRITARRNRLLGEWAARQMGLTQAEAEAYAKDVVRSDFEEAGEHDDPQGDGRPHRGGNRY